MGTISKETPPELLQDLKVTFQSTSLILPSQETKTQSIFLSNIDRILNFHVETVHFFPFNKDFPPEIVVEMLKKTLAEILLPYDFLAGRLRANAETGRLEIDCNGAGIVFSVASSEYALDDVGDLVYPNPAFGQLISKSMDNLGQDNQDEPLCFFQITSFKCGGFAMGISTNHTNFDGLAFKIFLDNLAALAAGKPLPVAPFNDRKILAARSPPHVDFPHHELLKLEHSCPDPVFEATPEELDFKIFRLTSDDISDLKEKAKAPSGTHIETRITGFNVVTALVWRCKALSSSDNTSDRISKMLYAVDIRRRLNPPLPRSYTGNGVLTAYAMAKCGELEEAPFWKLVEKVGEAATRMTNEYARSAIDWGEIYRGIPHGEFLLTSWWKLGFEEVDYPWGRPRYSCPVVYRRKDIILLFPDIENRSGVNVLVALPEEEMVRFQSQFHKFLANY
ncbi:hypothetical protein SLA2020_029170 [Shorea laevis]